MESALSKETILSNLQLLPDEFLLLLAQELVNLRPLGHYPGWYFSIDINGPHIPIQAQLRYAIWQIFNQRRIQKPLLHPWYEDSQIHLYLGNDLSLPTYVGGCIEPNEFAFMGSVLKNRMVMIDIGANDGIFTVFAARLVGEQGRVLAFEPSAREFARLQANIHINRLSNVEPIAKAISNENNFLELKICEYGHEGHNTLGNVVWGVEEDGIWGVKQKGTQTVEVCCLDSLPAITTLHRLDFIKMDVEGTEHKVLQGATQTIEKFKPIILLELSTKSLQHQGSSSEQVVQCLLDLDYKIYDFSPISGKPVLSDLKNHSDNIVASPHLLE